MRKVNFKVRNIGSEKYLSYVLDDDCDFDEELLDYLEDNKIGELIDIIYEEDDENDYFTYNITDRVTVDTLFKDKVNAEKLLGVIRGIATSIVNLRDLGIPISYIILHRGFTYVNPVTYDVKLICLPIESGASMNAEFRHFAKNLIVNAQYDTTEDCNYIAKVLNLLNVEKFTIRAFAGELTELMESAGMDVEEAFVDLDGGIEVSQSANAVVDEGNGIDDLPEFKDVAFDEEDDDGLDMYEEEPTEANTIFKDLDLDAEEPYDGETETLTSGESVAAGVGSVNMDAFDDSALEELKIDDTLEEYPDDEVASEEEAAAEPELDLEDIIPEIKPVKIQPKVEEIAHTAEGVTEVAPVAETEDKPVLIDTTEIDDLIDHPPVMKSIKINRAKIIQRAVNEIEDDKIENPTENIIASGLDADAEPETNMDPATIPEAGNDDETGSTVELTAGMNVVPDTEEDNKASNAPKAMPYIVRVNTGERVMINKAVFKIGKANRGVDFTISGNGAVSRVHAIIYQREDGCYLKDNKTTNSTYVNGQKLAENQEVLLKNDSEIVLGDEDFIFKLS
ncbi:MAG: FHA domain-containing protein [Coprococcus sp.]|jgi:hypothetical protein|uniref:FHA domain-containing protein n=1 Tax=Coprococcus sp. OM04-5BH TaxID=2293093 RepID=UPI000E4B60B6|nr:FHA domain-containing protein [Coprococcus sp. OM04-5BH]MEE0036194.1 FHA domain-containing protein [Coprococcus sp.]RHV34230.1 FHA domain-containing protein [Coprococcus sp. OM04-5BH]